MQTKIIGLLLCILVSFGTYSYGEHRGKILERSVWQANELSRKSSEALAVTTRLEENAKTLLKYESIKEDILNEKSNEIKAVHAMYDGYVRGSLRIPKERICGDRPTTETQVSNSTGTSSAATSTVVLPDEIERDLWQLARKADEVTASCRALQELSNNSINN